MQWRRGRRPGRRSGIDPSCWRSRVRPAPWARSSPASTSRPSTTPTFDALHATRCSSTCVICVRGQAHVTPDDQVAFSARWGRIEPHPYVPPIEGHPEIMRVYDPNPITVTWHADFTYAKQPPSVSLLLGRVIPAVRRRHHVLQRLPRLRGPVRRPARDARRPARGALRDPARDRQRHARGRDRQLAPGGVHAPGDRPARALRQRQLHASLRRLVRRRQPAAARPPLRPVRPLRVHLAPPVAGGRPPHLGQPLRAARGGRRHRRRRSARCTAPPSQEVHHDDRHPLDRQPRRPRRRTARRLDQAAPGEVPRRRPAHRDGAARARRCSTAAAYREAPGTEGDPTSRGGSTRTSSTR